MWRRTPGASSIKPTHDQVSAGTAIACSFNDLVTVSSLGPVFCQVWFKRLWVLVLMSLRTRPTSLQRTLWVELKDQGLGLVSSYQSSFIDPSCQFLKAAVSLSHHRNVFCFFPVSNWMQSELVGRVNMSSIESTTCLMNSHSQNLHLLLNHF